ncbi:unnamed protein product [Phytophthora fragariaefolia]|uniref:Unnamed protein product n=1 Tax=Phytophthora fragariaefolia TaxID=1490495 RepID=A0A9W6XE31_9STRA|nr:unnamed protein product [Phytophthora fragariaefolia]
MVKETQGKSQLRGSQLRSRQRVTAMAVALSVAVVFTIGLVSIVSTPEDSTATHDIVTRRLREYLVDRGIHDHDTAMEAQAQLGPQFSPPFAVVMEAQARRDNKPNPSVAAAMEAQMRVTGTGLVTRAPAKAVTTSHKRPASAMEAIPHRHEERVPDTVTDAEAKAEEAEEIAQEALQAALDAEERAEAAEAAADMVIVTEVGQMVGDAIGAEQISVVGEIEDSEDSKDIKDSKDDMTPKSVMNKRVSW